MRALLSFNETSPFLLPGSRLKTCADRPLHHLAPAADDVQQRPLDAVRRSWSTDGRAASRARERWDDRGGRQRPPRRSHGLHPHIRAGADPRLRARALRARARPARPRLGRGRGAAPLARRHARRGGLPGCGPAGGARRRRARLGLVLPALRGARQGRLVGARHRLRLERPLRQDDREVGDGGAEAGAACRRLASGEGLGCYALTEPGCGSDAAALATRAERTATGGC